MHLSLTTPLVTSLTEPLHPGRPMEAIAMPESKFVWDYSDNAYTATLQRWSLVVRQVADHGPLQWMGEGHYKGQFRLSWRGPSALEVMEELEREQREMTTPVTLEMPEAEIDPPDRDIVGSMPSETIARLCRQLKGLREAQGYTQAQAARLAGVSPGRWGQVERGDVSTVDVIERCAQAIGGRFKASIEPVNHEE